MKYSSNKRRILYIVTVLLVTIGLSVGFSAFQKSLNIEDLLMHVRLQKDTRITGITIENASGAVSNSEDYAEDYNVKKVYGSVTFNNSSSYMLYKVSLTNYGNVKMGLLDINTTTSGINYQVCNSNGSGCTNDARTAICNGSNCTLGASKNIYVKVSSTTSGTKNLDLNFNFQPYNDITYDNVRESTNSFPKEIMSTDSFTITLTSKPEEVEVSGTADVSYNKNTGVLTVSNVGSDLSITAKYLVNDIAEEGFSGTDPNNYVLYNNTLFRMIESNSIHDGYYNFERRTSIVKHESIGDYMFDTESASFSESSIANLLNTTYYNSLSDTAKEMIDTATWDADLYIAYVGLIDSVVADNYHSWLTYEGFLLISTIRSVDTKDAIIDGEITTSPVNAELETRPCVYLKPNVLIVAGSGTQANPYILELSNDGLQPNPTKIKGRSLTVTGSNQNLVTVEDQVGTPRYSISTPLNSSNYTSGSTTIPTASSVGDYNIYYYIPEGETYKPKSGMVTTHINGMTYTINYQKGSNIDSIGTNSDTCTTSGTNLSCSVTLPSITPNPGYMSVGWSTTNGDTTGETGSYTLSISNNGVTLYANAVVQQNYQNTTTLAYYGTLNDAFAAIENNQTIKVLTNTTRSVSATFPVGKTGALDLAGHTTTGNYNITNNGTLDIYSSVDGGVLTYLKLQTIVNNGTLTLNGTSSAHSLTISVSNPSANVRVISNSSGANLTINDNVTLSMSGAPSDATGERNLILNSGTVTMNGGTLSSTATTSTYNRGITLDNASAKFIMNGGTITTAGACIHNASATGTSTPAVVINNGTLTSANGKGIVNAASGTIEVLLGHVTGSTRGIEISNGTVSLGANDGVVNTTYPIVEATNTTSSYGIYNNSKTFNFYDGIIKSASGTGNSIYGAVSATPTNYGVQKTTTAGVESAILYFNANYQNVNTGDGYSTLNAAFAAASSNDTIRVTNNSVSESTTATLASGKTVKLDLNGKTITSSATTAITNNGSLDIYSSVDGGLLQSSGTTTISNNGTLTTNGTSTSNTFTIKNTSTATTACVINNAAGKNAILYTNSTLTMTGATTTTRPMILTSGIITVDGATLINTASGDSSTYDRGISIQNANGRIIINSGSVTTSGNTIHNASGTGTTTPAFEMTGGRIESYNQATVNNRTSGTMSISGGHIEGSTYAIYTYASGNINISGTAEIHAISEYGYAAVYNNSSATVNITGGRVLGGYAIYNSSSGTVNISGTAEIGSTSQGIQNSGTVNINGSDVGVYSSANAIGSDGIINVTAGTIQGETAIASSGTVTISGGEVNGYTTAIDSDGAVIITGGQLSGNNTIYIDGGTLTLGVNDSTISTTSPTIDSYIGIEIVSGTFNFYDGIIHATKGEGYAIVGTVSNTPTGYRVVKTLNNGVESAYLEDARRTATFYYNSNTTSGELTASSVTAECTITSGNSCTVSIPSVVSNSIGKYNSAYSGVSTSLSSMNTSSLAISENTVFYALYSSPVTIYSPNSTTTRISETYYRNEYFTSATAMNSIINQNNTATSNYSFSSPISGYEVYGFAINPSINTRDYSSIGALATSNDTTVYAILRQGRSATVLYNSGSGNGLVSISTATTNTAYQYVRCTSIAAEVINNNYTIPTAVRNSVGPYGNTYAGVSGATNSMTAGGTTAYTTLYAFYRSNNVTNYYYSSSYTNRTLRRNSVFTSSIAMKTVLSTSNTGTSNYGTVAGPGSSAWSGLSNAQDTTAEYSTVASAAASTATTLYTVYTFNATFAAGTNVDSVSFNSASCKVTTNQTSCTVVPPTVTVASGAISPGWTESGTNSNYALSDPITLSTNNRTYTVNAVIPQLNTPTISGGATKVYGDSTQLSCTATNNVGGSTVLYYSFGYSTTDGGTPGNWTDPTTTSTYNAPGTYTTRYYSCRVYVSDGTNSSNPVASNTNADQQVTYVNARIDFYEGLYNKRVEGDTPAYVQYNNTSYYSTRTSGTTSSLPNAVPIKGYSLTGWFTAETGGTKVINADGTLVASVSGWTTADSKWALTNTSDTEDTYKLYAQYSANTYTVTFDPNNGSVSPTTKTVTYDSSYGTLPTPTRSGYTFKGWISSPAVSLPSGYTQVDYVKSTGEGQYIETGLDASGHYRVELDGNFNSYKSNAPALGAWMSGHDYLILSSGNEDKKDINIACGPDNSTYWSIAKFDTRRHLFSFRNDGSYFDDERINTNISYTYPEKHKIYVFAASVGGQNGSALGHYNSAFTLNDLIFKNEDGSINRHYVPVVTSSNVPGLFNTVHNTFHTNGGNGSLQVGYVVNTTTVGIASDHTLTAIWVAN